MEWCLVHHNQNLPDGEYENQLMSGLELAAKVKNILKRYGMPGCQTCLVYASTYTLAMEFGTRVGEGLASHRLMNDPTRQIDVNTFLHVT